MGHTCDICLGINPGECPGNVEAYRHGEEQPDEPPKQFYAFNIITRKDVKVTAQAWMLLPDSEDEALYRGQNYCRQYEY